MPLASEHFVYSLHLGEPDRRLHIGQPVIGSKFRMVEPAIGRKHRLRSERRRVASDSSSVTIMLPSPVVTILFA